MEDYERINSDEPNNLRSEKSSAIKKESIPPYLVGIKTISRLEWDALVTVFAVFNCFMLTFYLAFECESMMVLAMKACGLFTDIVFCLDIYYNLMTTYIDTHTGDEIIKRFRILLKYARNRLLLDLFSAVPIFFIGIPCGQLTTIVTIVRLTKLERIFVVAKRLMYFRLRKSIRVTIKFFEMLLWLMIYVHLMACLWYYIIQLNTSWQPFSSIVRNENYYDLDLSLKYSLCIYTMVFSISKIEMLPYTEFEHAFLGFTVIIGMIIAGILFGSIIVMLQDLGKKSLEFAIEKEKMSTTIKNLNLPKELQESIIEFFTSSFVILDQEISYQRLITFLPPSITKKLNTSLFKQLFSNSKLFKKDFKVVSYLINKLENKFCQPEEDIIKQFEPGYKIYFVSEGSCEVEVLDELKEKYRVKVLHQGAHFGEIAVLFETYRTATVRSIDFATLAVLSKEQLETLFSKFPNIKKAFFQSVIKYKDPYRMFIERTLNKLSYLQGLDGKAFNRLIYSLPIISCPAGTNIFTAGDLCNSAFIILDGKVQIFFEVYGPSISNKLRQQTMRANHKIKKIKGVQLVVEELGKGSVLCQTLLILQQKFIVSCRCTHQARIMVFTKDHLDEVIQMFPDVKYSAEEIISKYNYFDQALNQEIQITLPLDYYKCQKYDNMQKYNMKSRLKFKNAVINRILTFRRNQKMRIPKIAMLMERLHAINKAEEEDRFDIAHKITVGDLPPEVIHVKEMLGKKNFTSPLVAQFAIKSKETFVLSETFKEHINGLQKKFEELKKHSRGLCHGAEDLISKYSEAMNLISK